MRYLQPGNVEKARSAPVNAVLAVDNSYHEHVPRLLPFRPEMREALEDDREMHRRIQLASGWMLAGYFILAVRAAGLAAGPMGGFDSAGLDTDLFPDGEWRSIRVVNIGYPDQDAWFERLPQLDYEEAVRQL
jgi:3-hydroxypropanoate dehydrogenase